MYSRTCLIHWRAYLFQIIRCCSAEWINFHHRSPFIVTNLTYQSSLQRCWNSYKTKDKVVQQHPTNTKPINMTINPMHHIVLYVEGEGATTNNNTNLPPSHNRCKPPPPWHTTIQPSILPYLLHPSSKCTLISLYPTLLIIGPMEAARSFLNMPSTLFISHQDNVLLELQIC